MSQFWQFICNDTTIALLSAGILYLAGAWLRPQIAKIPNTNWLFKTIRLLHLVLNKADPGGNEAAKLLPLLLAITALSQSACTASFEEVRITKAPMHATGITEHAWFGLEYDPKKQERLIAVSCSGADRILRRQDQQPTQGHRWGLSPTEEIYEILRLPKRQLETSQNILV